MLCHMTFVSSHFSGKKPKNTEAKALDTYHLAIGQKYEAY